MHSLEIGPTTLPKINFIFLPYHNTGGHFIIWSMYTLAGQTRCLADDNLIVDVISSNESKKTFHQQKIIRARGFENTKQQYKAIVESDCQLASVHLYVTVLTMSQFIPDQFAVSVETSTHAQRQAAVEYIHNDTKKLLDWMQQSGHPLIAFEYCSADLLNIAYNDRCPLDMSHNVVADIDAKWLSFEQSFFNKPTDMFDQTFIWDRREKLALILPDPIKQPNFCQLIDRRLPHLLYTTDDVWNDLFSVMPEIFSFINTPLDSTTINGWQNVYATWRLNHDQYFSRHFDRIIDAIVNNKYVSLTRFKMNFYKEVMIQQALIRRYSLNLKTWQLETFPDNTQELHKLLEPSLHLTPY